MLSSRPSWSVCGQSLCRCVPLDLQPTCPLCVLGESGGEGCRGGEPRIDPARIALVHTRAELVMLRLDVASESLLMGLFLCGRPASDDDAARLARARMTLHAWAMPACGPLDAPTPPPRA
jgi:hypothetical protein